MSKKYCNICKKDVTPVEDKCPNLLYYIDEEESDNDKKKKCVSEGDLCPKEYPYLLQYLQLCIELCINQSLQLLLGSPEERSPAMCNSNRRS